MKLIKKYIRIEAIVAIFLFIALVIAYLYFFLELHLKWFIERTAYQSIGSELNISKLDIDYLDTKIIIDRIQLTNPEKPMENIIEISKIYVDFELNPLFWGSFYSDLTEVKDIAFHTERSRAGKVLPKEKRLFVYEDPTRKRVDDELKNRFNKSFFSDIAKLLSSDGLKELEAKYKEKLTSLEVTKEIETRTNQIKDEYKDLESYVSSKEVKGTIDRAKSFKFDSSSTEKSLSSTKEALDLIEQIKQIKKQVDSKYKNLKGNLDSFNKEIKTAPDKFISEFNSMKSAGAFSLDPKQLTDGLLSGYFALQLNQMQRVTSSLKNEAIGPKGQYVATYIPKKKEGADEGKVSQMDLEKRRIEASKKVEKTYIFYKEAAYPKYWFKRINISSKAQESQDLGDVNGYINNFASPQEFINKPLEVNIKGSVPKQNIGGFEIEALIDKRPGKEPTENIKINVFDYLVKQLNLYKGGDEIIEILKSNSSTILEIQKGVENLNLSLTQNFIKPAYEVAASNKNLKSLLDKLKQNKEDIYIKLNANGDISKPKISLRSNFGDILYGVLKSELSDQVTQLADKYTQKAKDQALKKLGPYLDSIGFVGDDLSSLKSFNEKELNGLIEKLKAKNEDKIKDKAKDALKKLLKF